MDKLLNLLSTNSGLTTAEIATMLNEPEDYIIAQIKEYENKGIIKGYQAVVNWENSDDSFVEALIELKVTPKKETGFDEMAEKCMAFDEVENVTGTGLMIGIQLKTKKSADVCKACLDNGLLTLTAKEKLRLLPPLNITYEEIDKGLAILEKILSE